MKINHVNPEALVKRAFYLAWKACGGPTGMGFFQDKPNATEEEVWRCIYDAEDYEGARWKKAKPGKAHADYVFGRMMKLCLEWDEEGVTFDEERKPTPDYQMWCGKYPTITDLVKTAVIELA